MSARRRKALARASQSLAVRVCLPCSTDWRVGLPKLEWMALTACRRPGAALPGGSGGQPRLIRPGPVGRGRQGPASLSVHPAGRTGGADCLTACRQAGRLQTLYFLFLEFNKKPPRHFARFLASTPYSSELFLISRSLFHFLNFTLNTVPTVFQLYRTHCGLEFPLWQYCNFNLISLGIPALPISGSIDSLLFALFYLVICICWSTIN